VTIKPRGNAMNAANESAGSTTHHAEAQPAPHRSLVDRHFDFPDTMHGGSGEKSGCPSALQQMS
jgi:hypothetical protein